MMKSSNLGDTEECDQPNPNSISLDFFRSQISSESIVAAPTISIPSYNIIEEKLGKHVIYIIAGEENSVSFTARRRYKEFRFLDKLLAETWLGCILPKLPPKKAVVILMQGNLKSSFIEKRRKLLEDYLIKLCTETHYIKCSAFSLFIQDTPDYTSFEKVVEIPNLQSIATLYSDIFNEYTYLQPSLTQKSTLKLIKNDLEEILLIFHKVKKLAKASSKSAKAYNFSLSSVYSSITELNSLILLASTQERSSKTLKNNSFESLRSWVRSEILSFEAIIEGIEGYFKLEEEAKNMRVKIIKKQKSLEKIKSGKKSIGQMIFNKTQQSLVIENEATIDELENSRQSLERISDVCVARIIQKEIPIFQQQRINSICTAMKKYSLDALEDYEETISGLMKLKSRLEI